ncbi:hypothetical protein PORY_000304 [Pneumocystis oryctolagi]|uniref:Uncharacterized protein n=1 Tax=Pneumocystis oryctolagi TaxID=42067 RepID=A0ACB7CET8_9ASCO|nr:hypothetical protein PORY_000304 [Pneumocystis oryctolagi]
MENNERSLNSSSKGSKRLKLYKKKCENVITNGINDKKYQEDTSVGILCYVNFLPKRLHFVFKHRYTDFLVNEVDDQEKVIHLTNISFDTENSDADYFVGKKKSFELDENEKKRVIDILGEDVFQEIIRLLEDDDRMTKSVLTKVFKDKLYRTSIHTVIREVFKGLLDTTTTLNEEIKITFSKKNTRSYGNFWANVGGEYCMFYLYKENMDTMECINLLSKFLHVKSRIFSFAGTKDKRGCTVQRCTAWKIKAERLAGLNKFLKGFKIGNFSYTNTKLELGDLKGNEFTIILRDVKEDDHLIDQCLIELKNKGFVNYYGIQRFGTSTIRTHDVGILLLKSDWKGAVELLLKETSEKIQISEKLNDIWSNIENVKIALKETPQKCVSEYAILSSLAKESSKSPNYAGAFQKVPRNLRMMYIHAYQSYVWNFAVTERLRRFGFSPVEGDLVICDQVIHSKDDVIDLESFDSQTSDSVKIRKISRAKHLTKNDLANYSIYDIVLPTPGHDILYPDNCIKDFYLDFMKKDGIDGLNMIRPVKEFSLSGSYRLILSKPRMMEWEIIKYGNSEEQLSVTDMDILENRTVKNSTNRIDESLKAIKLKMQLSSSSYATVALREIAERNILNS